MSKSILGRFLGRYVSGWIRYGVLFSVCIFTTLLLAAQTYLEDNESFFRLVYYVVIFSFPVLSIALKVSRAEEEVFRYNPADKVAWFLGTKKAPPKHMPLLNAVYLLWLGNFLLIIGLDALIMIEQVMSPSVFVLAANALLLIHFIWSLVKE